MSIKVANVICPKCGISTKNDKGFCPCCGTFLIKDFNSELYSGYEKVMKRMIANAKRIPHKKVKHSTIISDVVAHIEDLDAVCRIPFLYEHFKGEVTRDTSSLISKYLNSEFQVAFVGTIKTGKSTLINALLGADYASVAVTPETTVLTKFKYSDSDYVKLKFYSHDEWDKLWQSRTDDCDTFTEEYNELHAEDIKNRWLGQADKVIRITDGYNGIKKELSKWSSSKSPEHYFVREITVGISNIPKYFPKNVVIVDTPGLSDPVQYRSQISYDYIRRANAVFVCIEAKKIQREEIATLSSVFTNIGSKNTDCVHVIATHWDQLNNPQQDWALNQDFMSKKLGGRIYFGSYDVAKQNIIHSSAYIYNLISRYLDGQLNMDSPEADRIELQNLFNFAKNIERVSDPIFAPTPEFKELVDKFKNKDQDLFNRLRESTNVDYIRKNILYEIIACKSFGFIEQQAVSDLETLSRQISRINNDVVIKPLLSKRSLLMNDFNISVLKEQKEQLSRSKQDCEKLYNQLNKYHSSVNKKTEELIKKLDKAGRK